MRIAYRGIADGVPAAQDGQSRSALDLESALGQVERYPALEHHLRCRSVICDTGALRNVYFQKPRVPQEFAHKEFVRGREKY